jgi:hypothetical protein
MSLLVKVQPKASFRFSELKQVVIHVFRAYPHMVVLKQDIHLRTSHI